jgi:hypothetical protein
MQTKKKKREKVRAQKKQTRVSIIKFSDPATCASPEISDTNVPATFAQMPKMPTVVASCFEKALFCIIL